MGREGMRMALHWKTQRSSDEYDDYDGSQDVNHGVSKAGIGLGSERKRRKSATRRRIKI
eukprot:IDg6820t1